MVKDKPSIEPVINGPYRVKNLKDFRNSRDETIETKPEMSLCSCGRSNNKPFCDGTHQKINFSTSKTEGRKPDRLDTYVGKKITIHDNRGFCSRAGYCSRCSPAVFNDQKEPWIEPDADAPEKTARTIDMCPSGALSYIKNGVLYKDQDRESTIRIEKNGPYCVTGNIGLHDPNDSRPESKEHYTLCRCGASKNKPFCDGTHLSLDFKDDNN